MFARRRFFICLLISFVSTCVGGKQLNDGCPANYVRFENFCYSLVDEVASYSKAESLCKDGGGILAMPKSLGIQLFLRDLIRNGERQGYDNYWVGIRKIRDSWLFSDHSELSNSFTYWASGQPRPLSNDDCVRFGAATRTKWLVTECHWGYRFICQADVASVLNRVEIVNGPDIHAPMRSTLCLECRFTKGVHMPPPLFMYWYHNERVLNFDMQRGGIVVDTKKGDPLISSTICIEDIRQSDGGKYTCRVSSKESATITVHIKSQPDAKIEILNGTSMHVKSGKDIVIVCRMANLAEPLPPFGLWHRSGQLMNPRVKIETGNGDPLISTLRLTNASRRDSGNYSCSPLRDFSATIDVRVVEGCDSDQLKQHKLEHNEVGLNRTGFVAVGKTLAVKCAEGRGVFVGSEQILCERHDHWRLDGTRCIPGCPPPPVASDARLLHGRSSYMAGEKPDVACAPNMVLVNPGITCGSDGRWVGQPPECKPRDARAVSAPPSPKDVAEPPTLFATFTVKTVAAGGSLSATCIPNNRRTPETWIWMKEQRLLERPNSSIPHVRVHTNGTLSILKMTAETEGLYTCLAESLHEIGGVAEHTLHVLLPKRCDLKMDSFPSTRVIIGDYVVLPCSAPDSVTSWFLGNKPLRGTLYHRTLSNGALLVKKSHLTGPTTFRCVVEHVRTLCRVERLVTVYPDGSESAAVCGQLNDAFLKNMTETQKQFGKIVGGHEAQKGSHPWVVIFDTTVSGREKFLCGGNLVAPQWVLTAAHCFYWVNSTDQTRSIIAKLGKHDRNEKEAGERVLGVSLIKIHPNFDVQLRTFDNDLALVRLDDKVEYSDHISPICLPSSGFLDDFYPVQYGRSSGLVSGWGRLQEDGLQPRYMHQVRLPLVDMDVCKGSTDQSVTGNMFCAGYAQAVGDSCQGDSGGPFEVLRDNRVYLAGIVSWGEGCARPGKYGFYTKIENYEKFIENYIED